MAAAMTTRWIAGLVFSLCVGLSGPAAAELVGGTDQSSLSKEIASYSITTVADPLLVVWTFSDDSATQPTAVSWGSQNLVFIEDAVQGSGQFSTAVSIWYLLNPQAGTEDLIATGPSGDMLMVAAVFDGISGPPELSDFDTPPYGSGTVLDFTTLTDGALIVSVGGTRDAIPTNTSGATEIYSDNAAGGGVGVGYGYGGIAGTHASSWGVASGNTGRWVQVAAVFPSSGPMQCPFSAMATDEIVPDAAGVIDLAAEYGVQCDGVTDDGPAIVQAIQEAETPHGSVARRVIKFPAGVCLSSQQLEWRDIHGHTAAQLTAVGAGEALTTIQATDNNPLFQDPGNSEWFIRTRSQWPCVGNCAFRNSFKHLTISTGSGNPGAVALDYQANNTGTVEDVTVRSEDGQGAVGISMSQQYPGPALLDGVTVGGFDTCADLSHFDYSMTAVDLECLDAPVRVGPNTFTLLRFRGPSVETTSSNGFVALSDSQLTGSGSSGISGPGKYALRRVSALGFDDAAGGLGPCAFEGHSSVHAAFAGSPSVHLGLPWVDPPDPLRSADAAHWNAIQDHGEGRAGLLHAMGTLHPIIYAADNGNYDGSFSIPPHVQLITGLGHNMGAGDESPAWLVVDQPHSEPLTIEFFNSGASPGEYALHVTAARPVYLRNVNLGRDAVIRVEAGAGPVWLDDVSLGHLSIEGAAVYARQLNIEGRIGDTFGAPHILCDGCELLVYGYKHESVIGAARVVNGGCAEIYGAHIYAVTEFDTPEEQDTPMWEVQDAALTVSYQETAYETTRAFPVVLRETRGSVTQELLHEDMPSRGHGTQGPLVSAWDGAGCPI